MSSVIETLIYDYVTCTSIGPELGVPGMLARIKLAVLDFN